MAKSYVMPVSGRTRLAGVIGWPITHTLSPVMHNAALAVRGFEAVYVPFGVPPAGLKPLLETLRALDALGVNVTIPYKERVLPWLDELAPGARRIGAVNTVVFEQGRLIGHNTDGTGFLNSLKGVLNLKGKILVILGAGGGGRAVAVAAAEAGAARVVLADPDDRRRSALVRHVRRLDGPVVAGVAPASPALRAALAEADLLVNATPLGLKPRDPLPVPPDWVPRRRCVMDLTYGPGLSPLLAEARQRKNEIIPGWMMLLHQGAESFRLWTRTPPPVDVMRRALVRALQRRGA